MRRLLMLLRRGETWTVEQEVIDAVEKRRNVDS